MGTEIFHADGQTDMTKLIISLRTLLTMILSLDVIVLDTASVASNKVQMNVRHTNWLVSVTHTTCVYCAVRTGCCITIRRVTAVGNAMTSSDGSFVAATQRAQAECDRSCYWHQHNNMSSLVRFQVLTAVLLKASSVESYVGIWRLLL